MRDPITYNVVIAGGGPAAVSAATLLGRNMRKVLLCDASHSDLESFDTPERMYYYWKQRRSSGHRFEAAHLVFQGNRIYSWWKVTNVRRVAIAG